MVGPGSNYENFVIDMIHLGADPLWEQFFACISQMKESTGRNQVTSEDLAVPREMAKLFRREKYQCASCMEFYTKRRLHQCKTNLSKLKWPKDGSHFFCLLCLQVRRTKEKLAIHYLASHNVNDLEMHLGLSLRYLYYGVRTELDPNEELKEAVQVQVRVQAGPGAGPVQEENLGLSMIAEVDASNSFIEVDDSQFEDLPQASLNEKRMAKEQ